MINRIRLNRALNGLSWLCCFALGWWWEDLPKAGAVALAFTGAFICDRYSVIELGAWGLGHRLRKLIAKWRQKAAVVDSFHATMGTGWTICANELETLLADPDCRKE